MQRIDFEARAVATLQDRVAAMAEANEDLAAFARGHAGAVAAIHEAVLAAFAAAEDARALARVVANEWPQILRVDVAALAWADRAGGRRSERGGGLVAIEPRLIARVTDGLPPVAVRAVGRGHPLFGAAGAVVRGEALIRLEGRAIDGLVLLGQEEGEVAEGPHGARLLRFLGRTMSLMLDRCSPR